MKDLKGFLLCLVLLTGMAGCVNRGAYSGFTSLPDNRWAYADTLTFRVERADSLTPGTLSVAVTNTTDYPYSNLWLEITYPHQEATYRDTVNLSLADEYGRWTGKGFGADFQSEAKVARGVVLPNGSEIKVRHILRADTLEGISQVGVTLNP